MTLDTLAAEFVRYWTTDRTPDGCGMCGGIPHSTTCYVGRMATLIGSATDSSQRSELLNGQERSAEQQTLQLPAEPQTPEPETAKEEPARPSDGLAIEPPWCSRRSGSGWVCTRPPGHDGQHVAGNSHGDKVYFRWPAAPVSSSARPDSQTVDEARHALRLAVLAFMESAGAVVKGEATNAAIDALILAATQAGRAEAQQEIDRLDRIARRIGLQADEYLAQVIDLKVRAEAAEAEVTRLSSLLAQQEKAP